MTTSLSMSQAWTSIPWYQLQLSHLQASLRKLSMNSDGDGGSLITGRDRCHVQPRKRFCIFHTSIGPSLHLRCTKCARDQRQVPQCPNRYLTSPPLPSPLSDSNSCLLCQTAFTQTYTGHRNVRTFLKEIAFLGDNQYVTTGWPFTS